jgi:hypothetical protein
VDSRQQRLDLPLPPALQSLVDLEKQRIESFNRRTDVVKYVIETNDASDKRQFDYQMAKLNAETTAATRRHSLLKTVMLAGGGISALIVGSLLGMTFFGNPAQAQLALEALKILMIGGGGYGLINGVVAAVRRLSH